MSETDPAKPVKKFSFGQKGGVPVAAPAPEATAPAGSGSASAAPDPATTAGSPAGTGGASTDTRLATQPQSQPPAFYTGDDETPADAGDIRFARLNIVQKSSGAELLKHGFGSLVLKGTVKLPLPIRMVVAGIRPKIWIEKVKFGTQGRVARSIDEVIQFGGTDKWTFSKENDKTNSTKAWFMPTVTLLVLIQRPDSLPEDNFPFEADGKLYVPALLTVKSTNYDAVFTAIQSEYVMGMLRKGYNSHFIDVDVVIKPFKAGESGVFKLSFAEETPLKVRELANSVTGR